MTTHITTSLMTEKDIETRVDRIRDQSRILLDNLGSIEISQQITIIDFINRSIEVLLETDINWDNFNPKTPVGLAMLREQLTTLKDIQAEKLA